MGFERLRHQDKAKGENATINHLHVRKAREGFIMATEGDKFVLGQLGGKGGGHDERRVNAWMGPIFAKEMPGHIRREAPTVEADRRAVQDVEGSSGPLQDDSEWGCLSDTSCARLGLDSAGGLKNVARTRVVSVGPCEDGCQMSSASLSSTSGNVTTLISTPPHRTGCTPRCRSKPPQWLVARLDGLQGRWSNEGLSSPRPMPLGSHKPRHVH